MIHWILAERLSDNKKLRSVKLSFSFSDGLGFKKDKGSGKAAFAASTQAIRRWSFGLSILIS